MSALATCACGSELKLRVSPSPFPGTEATIALRCDSCFAAGRSCIHWLAVTSEEEALS